MKVLIADDSATSRILLRGALLRWGYEVVVADNGAQAWEILAAPDAPLRVQGEINGNGELARTAAGAFSGHAALASDSGSITYPD